MKRIFLGLLACSLCLAGCRTGVSAENSNQPDINISAVQTEAASADSSELISMNEGKGRNMKNHKKRYGQASTEIVFITLNIADESGRSCSIVIDNSDWLRYAAKAGVPCEPISAYTEYMLAHETETFKVPADVYDKLSVYSAEEEAAELKGLSTEQILEKYFADEDGQYFAKDKKKVMNRQILKGLLDRDFFVYVDCESGCLMVKAPK